MSSEEACKAAANWHRSQRLFPLPCHGHIPEIFPRRHGPENAGEIAKYRVIDRKRVLVLQTGERNGHYADCQGDMDLSAKTMEGGKDWGDKKHKGPWTLVGKGGRKRANPEGNLTLPNTRPVSADKQTRDTAAAVSAWVDLTERVPKSIKLQP